MSTRELVLDVMNQLPENAPIEDEEVLERIAFVAGVQEAIAEADRGEGIPLEEVEKLIEKWAAKSL
jgi:predicted transcriptional regulator